MDSAIIFDVDGVLLDLTPAEEDLFFLAFEQLYGITGLSRDWDSYRIRNDEHIIAEILERHGRPRSDMTAMIETYVAIVGERLNSGAVVPVQVSGAGQLLGELKGSRMLGIATANLLSAARLRLERSGLWGPVSRLAFGAEGRGHKRETVARAIAATELPKDRIVYVGDNLNDVEAGFANGVHFIGFSTDPDRLRRLAAAGAQHVAGDHRQTARLIVSLLGCG